MSRVLEQELMVGDAQVAQYAEACAHPALYGGLAIHAIRRLDVDESITSIADIGCGPCVYHSELYTAFPSAMITAYDASPKMLDKAAEYIDPKRTTLCQSSIHAISESAVKFDFVFSSLVLHQLADPLQLWAAVKLLGRSGAGFAIFDLLRVEGEAADEAVDAFTPGGIFGETFCGDFKNSLRAAFTLDEIAQQLQQAGIVAATQQIDIAHGVALICITGRV
jgi:ubiquinone/menaquinone biosynthesis C-methylase UbiE